MEGPQIVKLLLTASILLLVFALGLRATFADATSLFRDLFRPPYRLLRALAAMYVVVPAVAVALGLFFDLSKPIRTALLAIAVAPIPPILPGKQLKVGGTREYVFGLLVAVSLSAIVLVPFMVGLVGRVFARETAFGPAEVARLIGTTILIPLAAGLLVRQLTPRWAGHIAPWASRLGTVLLVAGVVLVLIAAWPAIISLVGHGAMLAIVVLAACAIGAGHWLGGPEPDERSTLAIASAMRHPGIALAIAALNVPEEPRVGAGVLLYVLVATVLTTAYGAYHRSRRGSQAGTLG